MNMHRFVVSSFILHFAALTMIALLHHQVRPVFRDLVVDLSAGLQDGKEGSEGSRVVPEEQPAAKAERGEGISMSDDLSEQPDMQPVAEASKKPETEEDETDQTNEREGPNPPPAAEAAGVPAADSSAMFRHYQRMLAHTFAFAEGSGSVLRSFLTGQIPQESGSDMKGAFAEIVVTYDEYGQFSNADVATNSPELLSLLKQFPWLSMPSPSMYMLRSRGVFMKVTMEDGSPRIAVKVF